MATPTYTTVLSQINTYIVANGNNEITANVLNPILRYILDFSNNNIGDLEALTTSEKETIVDSINSLKQAFDNLSNNGIQLFTGINNPNDIPPTTYNYADFYMQLDVDDLPVKLWQWNGFDWIDLISSSVQWGSITGNLSDQSDLQSALNSKENTIASGTTDQYYRGDKTWQALDKTAVGLANVDNTSDLNKPVSAATQAALNGKQNTITGVENYLAKFGSAGVMQSQIREHDNGNVLVNKTLDDGSKLQVSGTISSDPAITSNQVVTLGQLNSANNENVKLLGDQSIDGTKTFLQPLKITKVGGVGKIEIDGDQDLHRKYILQNGITGISNAGFEIRDDTGGFTPIYIRDDGKVFFNFAAFAPTATAGTNTTQIATTAFVLANSQTIPQLENNATDLTVWNNGKSNVVNNTSFGDGALKSNTVNGFNNTAFGFESLQSNTDGDGNTSTGSLALRLNNTGGANTAIGFSSLSNSTTGGNNTALGANSLINNTTGGNNTALGANSGRFISDGVTINQTSNSSIFLGSSTRSLSSSQTNEIVIGNEAIGAGSNTATLGNASIIRTILSGVIQKRTLDAAPTSATDTGILGEIRVTTTHIYVCTATNTWMRAALSSW